MSVASAIKRTWNQFIVILPRISLLVICSILALGALVLPIAIRQPGVGITQGDVATQDVSAPRTLTYTSQILTNQAKEEAMAKTSPVYLSTDPSITRGQIEKLKVTLDYISTVRFDSYTAQEEKIRDISSLEYVSYDRDTIIGILNLSDSRL